MCLCLKLPHENAVCHYFLSIVLSYLSNLRMDRGWSPNNFHLNQAKKDWLVCQLIQEAFYFLLLKSRLLSLIAFGIEV